MFTKPLSHITEERLRTDASKRQRLGAERNLRKTEKEMADRQRCYNDNIRQLQQKMIEDATTLRKEQEKVLDARLQEQAKLLEEGFEERSKAMQQDINRLKEELVEAEKNADQQIDWESIASVLKPVVQIIGTVAALAAGFI